MKSAKATSQLVNNNAQNGRQQYSTRHTAPPTDPRKKINSTSKKKPKEICRDFLWGKCTKGTMCIHLHKMDVKVLKETVRFCHNFQNNVVCDDCNFLHVSSDEEKLFEKEGKIPRLLIERYKALNYDLGGIIGKDKPQLQQYGPMYNIGNYLTKPPPPPPPSPCSLPGPVPPGSTISGPMPPRPTMSGPMAPRPTMSGPMVPRPTICGPMPPRPAISGPMSSGSAISGPIPPGPALSGPMLPGPAISRPPRPPLSGPPGPPLSGPPGPPLSGPPGPPLSGPPGPPLSGPPGPPLSGLSLPGPPLPGPQLPGPCTQLQSMLALPPPPPPPLPPLPMVPQPPPPKTPTTTATITTATTSTTSSATKKTSATKTVSKSPTSSPGILSLNQPPPARFDPSKPPPPYKPQLNGAIKRSALDLCEAGQRKKAKMDAAKSLDSDCNNCVQRELRIELFKQEMKVLQTEQENKRKLLKLKTMEHERALAVLKANIDPKYYQWFEDYIEGVTTSTKTVLVQVLKSMAANGKLKNLKLSQSQFPLEDALLTTLTRRRPTNLDDSTRLLKVLGLLANNTEKKPEMRNTEINTEIRINASSIVKNAITSPINGFITEKKEVINEGKQKKLPPTNKPPPPVTSVKPGPATQPPLPPCNGIIPYQLPHTGVSTANSFYNNNLSSTSTNAPTPQPSTSKQPVRMKIKASPRPAVPPVPVSIQNGQGFNFQYNVTMRYPPPPPYQ